MIGTVSHWWGRASSGASTYSMGIHGYLEGWLAVSAAAAAAAAVVGNAR